MEKSNLIHDEDNYDNDDLISFQYDSKTINLSYSQFVKYSKHVREKYVFSDIHKRLPDEIHKYQEESQLSVENILHFFKLLKQNYNINSESKLTYIECIDLLKISKHLEVRKLVHEINDYINKHNNEVDFMIEMIIYETKTQKVTSESGKSINTEIEHFLSKKINECITNEKFIEIPISNIYRIIKQSQTNNIISDNLFDFIKKSMNKLCILFQFVDISKLSEDRFSELFELYSKNEEKMKPIFNFMKCDLKYMNEMKETAKKLQQKLEMFDEQRKEEERRIEELESKVIQLEKRLNISEEEKTQVQKQLKISEEEKTQVQQQLKISEEEKTQVRKQLKISEEEKTQVQQQLKISEEEKTQVRKQLKISEEKKKDLQQQLEEEKNRIECKVIASVKRGLLISAQIKITLKGTSLDTKRSKYIISTNETENHVIETYESGYPITSEEMSTNDILCKPGRYCVRCIIFDSIGQSREFMSNSVTTSGSSVSFDYEGKSTSLSVTRGKYKLEVWGSKGGDSTGERACNSPGKGGLGGYSSGILQLKENEVFHIFVGGEGRPSNSSDGSTTRGGFPDGGSTKTGHCDNYTSVPGTGGGSTSIRIGGNTNYSRVIVAGGGGGASGSSYETDQGGFGGGLSGGNCYYESSLQSQGSGTQTGSTSGRGSSSNGDPGQFGIGATGKYKSGCDSGGGGGGGWYGGGSGGPGFSSSSGSGGGGSGWTFNESSFNLWRSGDSSNSSKFLLNSSHYLSNTQCKTGEEEFPRPDGNGTERGHSGNGYAKITPIE